MRPRRERELRAKRRNTYSPQEERQMWEFIARELRAGNKAALNKPWPMRKIWKKHQQEHNITTKTRQELGKHFRGKMLPRLRTTSGNRMGLSKADYSLLTDHFGRQAIQDSILSESVEEKPDVTQLSAAAARDPAWIPVPDLGSSKESAEQPSEDLKSDPDADVQQQETNTVENLVERCDICAEENDSRTEVENKPVAKDAAEQIAAEPAAEPSRKRTVPHAVSEEPFPKRWNAVRPPRAPEMEDLAANTSFKFITGFLDYVADTDPNSYNLIIERYFDRPNHACLELKPNITISNSEPIYTLLFKLCERIYKKRESEPNRPDLPLPMSIDVFVPRNGLGYLIGRNGRTIHAIRQDAGGDIKIVVDPYRKHPDPPQGFARILIFGAPIENIRAARAKIISIYQNFADSRIDPDEETDSDHSIRQIDNEGAGDDEILEVFRRGIPGSREQTQTSTIPQPSKKNRETKTSSNTTRMCVRCEKNERATVFIPCGHVQLCVDCASDDSDVCPLCRTPMNIYFLNYD